MYPYGDVSYTDDLNYLAEAIYFEGRSELSAGQMAIAQVIINRVRSKHYPNTIKEVVHQRKGRICQFSYYCDGRSERIKNRAAYLKALQIASFMLNTQVVDLVDGADHYFNPSVLEKPPKWVKNMKYIGKVGEHVFYKQY